MTKHEELERELWKDWRYRFWHYVYWIPFQIENLIIRYGIWKHRRDFRKLVIILGRAADTRGITEKELLDSLGEIKDEIYEEMYGDGD